MVTGLPREFAIPHPKQQGLSLSCLNQLPKRRPQDSLAVYGCPFKLTDPMAPFSLPLDYPRIRRVASFSELVATPFEAGINAICWERELKGDFAEVVLALGTISGVEPLEESQLAALRLSAAGQQAVATMIEDLRGLRAHTFEPVLNCIMAYPREEDAGPVRTDVLSFHADRTPIPTATWLCTYHGRPSEGLRNDEAVRRVDIPETRAALLKDYGGPDDASFCEHLSESCYDLHYAAMPDARPFSFGIGNLWRIACEYPDAIVPPCIHRAPEEQPGDSPRLLLIS
jgi:hypothetical protein